ncbi:MAG: prepilin-type N-terminal cleavage/methylation domain-containing protein [Vicinamibacterales bacterium]
MNARQSGYSLVELLVSTAVTLVVAGAAGLLATSTERIASVVEREHGALMDAQFTLDWIVRTLEQAGSHAYGTAFSASSPTSAHACGGGGASLSAVPFSAVLIDPDGNGVDDDVRVRMDVNPPNGWLGGWPGLCDESGEDVAIGFDPAAHVVTRQDVATDTSPVAVSGAIVRDLRFTYRDGERRVTRRAADVSSVEVVLTVTTGTGPDPRPRVHRAEVWLRR